MKCSLNGNHARTIAKAIQSLAKFGSDLYVEADDQALQLRTFNSSKSAMGTFRFKRTFFESYQVSRKDDNYCKIAMKVCLGVFKNMKQVEHCDIQLLVSQAKLQIQFKCRLETVKNVLISIVDEDNVTTSVTAENATNIITGSYKTFNDISNNFNAAELEITLEAENDGLKVKNYIEGARVNDKFMRSQLKLRTSEFEVYNLQQETVITFCLKEFRAFLAFAESLNENVTLNFNQPGDPVFITIKKHDSIECNLIMSTLFPEDVSFHDELRESEVTASNIMSSTTTTPAQKRKHLNCADKLQNRTAKRRASAETTLSNDTSLFQFKSDNNLETPPEPLSIECARNSAKTNLLMTNEEDNLLLAAVAAASSPTTTDRFGTGRSSPVHDMCENSDGTSCDSKKEDESIPQSPQRARALTIRRVFTRCFENTYRPKEPSPNSQVYVPDSDADD